MLWGAVSGLRPGEEPSRPEEQAPVKTKSGLRVKEVASGEENMFRHFYLFIYF